MSQEKRRSFSREFKLAAVDRLEADENTTFAGPPAHNHSWRE